MSPTLSLHLMVRNLPPGQRRPKIAQAIGEESAGRLQRVLLERALRLPDRGFSAASSGSTTIWTAICRRWLWHWAGA